LVFAASKNCEIFLIDPGDPLIPSHLPIKWIKEKAGKGMEILTKKLLEK
jgi:hypothetical protein